MPKLKPEKIRLYIFAFLFAVFITYSTQIIPVITYKANIGTYCNGPALASGYDCASYKTYTKTQVYGLPIAYKTQVVDASEDLQYDSVEANDSATYLSKINFVGSVFLWSIVLYITMNSINAKATKTKKKR